MKALECPYCHSYTEPALMEDKRLQVCLQCCHVAAIDDLPREIVVTAEEEERFRLGQPGKTCAGCDD